MTAAKIKTHVGSLEPQISFDWVIPDFLKLGETDGFKRGPSCEVRKNLVFGLGCHPPNIGESTTISRVGAGM